MILSHCCRYRVTPNLPKKFVYLIAAISLTFVGGITVADAPKVIEELTGKVVAVTDGDTIKVLVNNATVKVRLEGIDAPEAMQSFGNQSKEALAKLVAGKTVTIRKTGTDKYQRTLGYVMVDGVDANAKLVQDGWACQTEKMSADKVQTTVGNKRKNYTKRLGRKAYALADGHYANITTALHEFPKLDKLVKRLGCEPLETLTDQEAEALEKKLTPIQRQRWGKRFLDGEASGEGRGVA